MIEEGASLPFTDLDPKHPGAFGVSKERTTPAKLTKDTDTGDIHNFISARDLADYDIKLNIDDKFIRDTDLFDAKSKSGTNYEIRRSLKNLGSQMTDRIRSSMNSAGAIRSDLNLFGAMAIGSPMSVDVPELILNAKPTDLYGINSIDKTKKSEIDSVISDMKNASGSDENQSGSIKALNVNAATYKQYADQQSGIRMGDAKVLNPDFQFNEMDDIRTNFRRPRIGRLYSERIYDYNLPVVFIQPGTVDINMNAISTWSSLSMLNKGKLTNYLKDGNVSGLQFAAMKLGNILNTGIAWGAKTVLDTSKWYKWTPSIRQYMKFVNELLIELAVWMGLIDASKDDKNGILAAWTKEYAAIKELRAGGSADDVEKALNNASGEGGVDEDDALTVVPGYLGRKDCTEDNGILSVIQILPQYKRYYSGKKVKEASGKSDDTDEVGWPIESLCIPFGLCKGVSVSESFSNGTTEHPMVGEYNRMFEDSNQTKMMAQSFGTSQGVKDAAQRYMGNIDTSSFGSAAMGVLGNVFSEVGEAAVSKLFDGELGMVASGAGRFTMPEIWSNSTFDRSYNISLKFRSPYGHRLSIFENTLVPLLFLIAMTAPRAIGISSYTNPFYIKAFSKGLFNCEMGMITSLSISRGEDKNDRTYEGFFRTVSVSISIKDMVPTMQMGLDAGLFGLTKTANNGMIGYMCNLAGVDLVERANMAADTKLKMQSLKTSVMNLPNDVRIWFTQVSSPGRFIGTVARAFGKGAENPFSVNDYAKRY